MHRKPFFSACLIAVALVAMGLTASCDAPLDATGSYSGTWSFVDNATTLDNATEETRALIMRMAETNAADATVIDCPLSMTLSQDVTLDPPGNLGVSGTVHIDFACLAETSTWPSWVQVPAPADVTVTGLMSADGKLTLASAGCGTGVCVILGLDGIAESDDAQQATVRRMTQYSGDWGFAVGIAFLGNLGVSGTFDVTRDDD